MESKSGEGSQTFAAYLAKHYIAKKGFIAGTVPEAARLEAASDIVLTRSDGMSFQILCIIDREAHPGKQFPLSRDAVEEIGKQCLKYSGSVSGNRMPVTLQVMEIGGAPITEADRVRLKAFKRKSLFSKVVLFGWIVDTAAASVWSNAPFKGLLAGRKFIERLMQAPRSPEAELQQPAPKALPRTRFPVLTCALLALLAAVFAVEHVYGLGASSGLLAPGIQTLVALGGLNRNLVLGSGEWYRLFSAALLHGDLLHLLLNGLALYLAGAVLESLVGRRWFFALFVIGALGGSLASLALNPPTIVSVGASGAIMGLLAAAFVCSFRYPSGAVRTQMQMNLLQVLIPSLIPIAVSRTGAHVDFAGHLGGALSGALVGLAMLTTWRATNPLPAFLAAATAVSIAGFAAFAFAFFPLAKGYPSYALDMMLIPSDQLPKSNLDAKSRSSDLVARYPRDPRSRLYQATALLDKQDLAGAARELRTGLAEDQMLRTKFAPSLEARMRTMLALVLLDKGELGNAKQAARPVCSTPVTDSLREALMQARLCD